jgi:hypothetical protein
MDWRLLTLGRCIWVRNVHRLYAGHNLLSPNFTIRLNDGQSQWSRPHNGCHLFLAPARGLNLTSTLLGIKTRLIIEFHSLKDTVTRHRFRNDACGGGQPGHDVIRALKQITDALQYLTEQAYQNPFIWSEGSDNPVPAWRGMPLPCSIPQGEYHHGPSAAYQSVPVLRQR